MPRKRKDHKLISSKPGDKLSGKLVKPCQRHAANARERMRMRVLSKAFSKLKTTLPWVPPDTKLSKLDTLRLASNYIAHLGSILECNKEDAVANGFIHPINLTWPFSFTNRVLGTGEMGKGTGSDTGSSCIKNDSNSPSPDSDFSPRTEY